MLFQFFSETEAGPQQTKNNTEVLIKREPLVLPGLGALYRKKGGRLESYTCNPQTAEGNRALTKSIKRGKKLKTTNTERNWKNKNKKSFE